MFILSSLVQCDKQSITELRVQIKLSNIIYKILNALTIYMKFKTKKRCYTFTSTISVTTQ